MSLNWDLSYVFLMIKLGLYVFGNKIPKVKCHFYHVISRIPTINMTFAVNVNLYFPAYLVFIILLCCKLPLFSPVLFGRKPLCAAHVSRGQNYASPHRGGCIYINYIEFFYMGYLSVLPLLFIYSIIYSHQ